MTNALSRKNNISETESELSKAAKLAGKRKKTLLAHADLDRAAKVQ
jgi:hypothetical protein